MALGLPVCGKLPERKGALCIAGSGPSLADHLDELRDADVWAINGAYDYLVGHNIIPTGFVGIDPLPGLSEYVLHAQPETTFYIASSCDPEVFRVLTGFDVRTWNAEAEGMLYPVGQYVVGGGTTALTRAPFLAQMMGWRDITLYGADSSFIDGRYCYRWGTYACDFDCEPVKVNCNGEVFFSEIGLMKQVAQLGFMQQSFRGMLKFRCGGLMDAFLRAPMMDDSDIEVVGDARPDAA